MLSVLPVINCEEHDGDAVVKKLRTAEEFSEWVHLDVADGIFTFARSWGKPEAWKELHPVVQTEVHLMMEHPEKVVPDWIEAGAKRIIVHYEAFPKTRVKQDDLRKAAFAEIVERCHHAGVEVMLAINPETSLEMAKEYLPHFDGYQVFSQAHPGPSAQPFLQSVLPKISALREQFPDATIEVDGGVNLETARIAAKAGANVVVAGSYIFNAPDPNVAYEALRSVS